MRLKINHTELTRHNALLQEQAEAILCGSKTTLKVHSVLQQKFYFIDAGFEQKVRTIQIQAEKQQTPCDALIMLLVDEITHGRAVLANKRTDGKLHVFATKEIAEKIAKGELSLKGKKGKVREIGQVEEVSVEFFRSLIQALLVTQGSEKGAKTEKVAVKTAPTKLESVTVHQNELRTTSYGFDPKAFIQELITIACKSLALDILELEEAHRIIARMQKKEQEAQLEESDRLLWEIAKYQIRRTELLREQQAQAARRQRFVASAA